MRRFNDPAVLLFVASLAGSLAVHLPTYVSLGWLAEYFAERAAAGVAHMHGAGGVCGYEFHKDFFRLWRFRAAVPAGVFGDGPEHIGIPAVRQPEI